MSQNCFDACRDTWTSADVGRAGVGHGQNGEIGEKGLDHRLSLLGDASHKKRATQSREQCEQTWQGGQSFAYFPFRQPSFRPAAVRPGHRVPLDQIASFKTGLVHILPQIDRRAACIVT